jgi:hypothetical protein
VSAERLRKKLAEIDPKNAPYWDVDSDSGKKKLANAWRELNSTDGYRQNLTGRAQAARVPGIVVPRSEKRGRDNAYWLEVQPVELPALPEAGPVLPVAPPARVSGEITYLEELEVPLPILKRPLRVSVQGWRGLLLVGPVIVSALAIIGLVWLMLAVAVSNVPARTIFQWSVLVAMLVGMIAWCTWPLYRLVEDGIVMAPSILQFHLPLGHVLVVRTEDVERVVRMVRYVCEECPLCGGKVTIHSGRQALRGRLVGACDRNSVEHLFSFDHVIRRGKLLR